MPRSLVLPLYGAAIFLSAVLLFLVEPLYARMLLPRLGGAPAVWNTAMVFYQAVLLLGYGYVHFAMRRLGPARQSLVHLGVALLPLVVLPLRVPEGFSPSPALGPALADRRLAPRAGRGYTAPRSLVSIGPRKGSPPCPTFPISAFAIRSSRAPAPGCWPANRSRRKQA